MEETTLYESLLNLLHSAKSYRDNVKHDFSALEKQYLKTDGESISYKDAYAQLEMLQAIKELFRKTERETWEILRNITDKSFLKEYKQRSILFASYSQEKKYKDYLLKHPDARELKISEDTLNFLRTDIRDLELSTRTLNVMIVYDMEIVADVAIRSRSDFMKYRNFGASSLKEVQDLLSSHGITLDYLLRYDEETKEYYTIEK